MLNRSRRLASLALAGCIYAAHASGAFDVDATDQPPTHPPLTPGEGEIVALNPPPMIWRVDARAATYVVEMARDRDFAEATIRVEGIDLPLYNHDETLPVGDWFWRYFAVTADGAVSRPSEVKSFVVTDDAVPFPVPDRKTLLSTMPAHPRIFTRPEELEEFRSRRHGAAGNAWREVQVRAEVHAEEVPELPRLVPKSEAQLTGPTPDSNSWREGQPVRRQIFFLRDGEPFFAPGYGHGALNADAAKAHILSYAYLISGEERYAEAARRWANFVASARVDFHIPDDGRASHDTAVYAYEQGLKNIAVTYDRIQQFLSDEEKRAILDHIEFHGQAAYVWLRDRVQIHLAFQQSHPQQAMHPLLITALAVATESEAAAEWMDYLVRQYANRIAWTSDDGGYFEGQTYGHKFQWILEALVAMRTATGIDAFQKPRIRNSGAFWLYCMSLNYWFEHGGDIYSLIWPFGNRADGYITNLLAAMNEDRYVQWWSDTVFTDPVHVPFQYISDTALKPKPPVDIPQARLFPQTGQVAAYDRFYDHGGSRIFFRSSPWGAHSHAHADQNNFVIHSRGEILAADVGYYTYYGDEYHMQWSVTTNVHNTILVNGKGQPKSIESKGEITRFFEIPDYTFFAGDASAAYEEPLTRYVRSILFLRPDLWVVHDELEAKEPSEFTWLLNTFSEPEIREEEQVMIVPQRDMRLRVDHLLPEGMNYESSNERRFPIRTRDWARFTEAFPEPWHSRVTTPANEEENILTVLHSYDEGEGARVRSRETIQGATTRGVLLQLDDGSETVLFRRKMADPMIAGGGVTADAAMASLSRERDGSVRRFVAVDASRLQIDGRAWLAADGRGDFYLDLANPASAGQLVVKGLDTGEVSVRWPVRPSRILVAVPHREREAEEIEFAWADGRLRIPAPGLDEWVAWIDPVGAFAGELTTLPVRMIDGSGEQVLALEMASTDNGEWIAFGDLMPREPGRYRLRASRDTVELLVQDRWDPVQSRRGRGSVDAVVRDGTEIFVRFAPTRELPEVLLELVESHRDRIVSVLRNGDFEEGIPHYPPRGWTMSRTSRDPAEGWPGWSQEDSFAGESAMRFFRPSGLHSANSQPMRLRTGGTYVWRFMAKGDATQARALLTTGRGVAHSFRLTPSEEWREYRVEVELDPGYAQLHIRFEDGGEPDQLIWIDDMEFGLLPGAVE